MLNGMGARWAARTDCATIVRVRAMLVACILMHPQDIIHHMRCVLCEQTSNTVLALYLYIDT